MRPYEYAGAGWHAERRETVVGAHGMRPSPLSNPVRRNGVSSARKGRATRPYECAAQTGNDVRRTHWYSEFLTEFSTMWRH
jgi:hypothetical protein